MKDLLSVAFVGLLDGAGFALLGESLFSVTKKVTKNACPYIRPRLRRGSFAPSPLRGSSYKDHPWPFTTLAASLRLAPLRNDSAHPSERGVWCRLMVCASGQKSRSRLSIFQATRTPCPVRRPSGGVAQGDARHGRRARSEGAGTPLRDGPRSSTGAREPRRSRGRMSGALSLWLLSLSREQRESDSAGGPKPEVPAHSVIALTCKLQA